VGHAGMRSGCPVKSKLDTGMGRRMKLGKHSCKSPS
jgi:hypothetical protein